MTDQIVRARARERAFALLGPTFGLWKKGFAEERRKGTSEKKIRQAVDDAVAGLEKNRGVMDGLVIDEMILILKECAFATHDAPRKQ